MILYTACLSMALAVILPALTWPLSRERTGARTIVRTSPALPRTPPEGTVQVRLSRPRYCPDVVTRCQRIRLAYDAAEQSMSYRLASIPYTSESFYA